MKLNPFRREGLVARLCRESGHRWRVAEIQEDLHYVRNTGPAAVRFTAVRYREGTNWMKFTAVLPVRLPFTGTPAGVFARLLIRNTGLRYTHWNLDLGGSCEGQPYLVTQWPLSIMSASVFDATCSEIDGEIRGFLQELRDKFGGDVGRSAPPAGYGPQDDDIRFLGPVLQRLPDPSGPPMLGGR